MDKKLNWSNEQICLLKRYYPLTFISPNYISSLIGKEWKVIIKQAYYYGIKRNILYYTDEEIIDMYLRGTSAYRISMVLNMRPIITLTI